MRRKQIVTLVLLAAVAGATVLAFRSYRGIDSKLSLKTSAQATMQEVEVELSAEDTAEDGKSVQDEASAEAENVSASPEKEITLEPEVTDVPEEEEPEEVNPETPVLTLKSDQVEITAGESFNIVSQVEEITDNKDERYRLFRNIEVFGEYDTDTAGEYILEYVVTDRDGNRSIPRKLTLIVKEKS